MMRVLLDCRMAGWTGVGRYTRGLARALAERDDIELVQLTAPGEAPPAEVAASRECAGHPFTLSGARAFAGAIGAERPDVVHCPHFPTPMPLSHPLVVTVHDFIPLVVPGVMPSRSKRIAYRLMLRRAVRGADRILTLSEHSARETRAFYEPSGTRITVTPAAADDFAAGPVGALPDGMSEGRFVLGLGSTRPHKRLDVLLRAWSEIALETPGDVRLALTGEAPTGEAPPPERVVWLGRVDDDTLRALYSSAAAFVFPSSHEGFGLPPLEAMSFGAPVVCTDAASLPEVVGDAALTVQPLDAAALGDAIARVVTDAGLHDDLAARGRARAARFSWKRTAELTVAAYREVAGGR